MNTLTEGYFKLPKEAIEELVKRIEYLLKDFRNSMPYSWELVETKKVRKKFLFFFSKEVEVECFNEELLNKIDNSKWMSFHKAAYAYGFKFSSLDLYPPSNTLHEILDLLKPYKTATEFYIPQRYAPAIQYVLENELE